MENETPNYSPIAVRDLLENCLEGMIRRSMRWEADLRGDWDGPPDDFTREELEELHRNIEEADAIIEQFCAAHAINRAGTDAENAIMEISTPQYSPRDVIELLEQLRQEKDIELAQCDVYLDTDFNVPTVEGSRLALQRMAELEPELAKFDEIIDQFCVQHEIKKGNRGFSIRGAS